MLENDEPEVIVQTSASDTSYATPTKDNPEDLSDKGEGGPNKGRILLIEDDLSSAKIIQLTLARENYEVNVCNFGEEAVKMVRQRNYDAILLDLMLPDRDGIDVLKNIREIGSDVPVLILSGLRNIEKKLIGLEVGADDYVTKPFDRRELLARLAALIRRSRMDPTDSRLKVAGLSFDDAQQCVYFNKKAIALTKKEYAVLRTLALANGKAMPKEEILKIVYQPGARKNPKAKIIDVFIYKIRSKLNKATGGKELIHTHWRHGLALRDPEL